MTDFEKLGVFYLGRECAPDDDPADGLPLLYDARDLATHAAIIGMTGSGKTGLGVALIEEAALDGIPVIAIDPKGDLGNLLLTFPNLAAEDFLPWVDAGRAAARGQAPEALAGDQAALWRKGLADWGQDGGRIQRLREAADFAIFTPGSNAGIPISALRGFSPPDAATMTSGEALAEHATATATSILALLGIDADPLGGREHILLSTILQHAWSAGRTLDLAALIDAVQSPPMTRLGIMDLEAIYPADERFALAMQLNNLLASPRFTAWREGVPLSAKSLLYTNAGRPRVSVVSIAHLADAERMFFVTLLLGELIAWMRNQPETTGLRAILYMDELFGFMPPTANPPSKPLLLTLLKQARASGLGLVLSTQNPADLDHKGLSNTGTWFIGRLQTERDKARLLDGLAGTAPGNFDRAATERLIAGLGKRRFLLHDVHASAPALFETRWVMSYLAGPMTRAQIRTLMAGREPVHEPPPVAPPPSDTPCAKTPPVLPPGIPQYFLPATDTDATVLYRPRVAGIADVHYLSAARRVNARRRFALAAEVTDGPITLDWRQAEPIDLDPETLADAPPHGAVFAALPAAAREPGTYRTWAKDFARWLRQENWLTLFRSEIFRTHSTPRETEADFRIRLRELARERRDTATAELRERYERKAGGLREDLRNAEARLAHERDDAGRRRGEALIQTGTALLGAFLGRRRVSRVGLARIADLDARLATLAAEFEADVAALTDPLAVDRETFRPLHVRARATNIDVRLLALVWIPERGERDATSLPRPTPASVNA